MLLLILGPTTRGNDINVQLCLLIDELNELWNEGVNTYDAHTSTTFCYVQHYYELLVFFLHTQRCLVGT